MEFHQENQSIEQLGLLQQKRAHKASSTLSGDDFERECFVTQEVERQ